MRRLKKHRSPYIFVRNLNTPFNEKEGSIMDKLTNREIMELGVATTKIMIKRLYDNGLNYDGIVKFTGLKEATVSRLMKELNIL